MTGKLPPSEAESSDMEVSNLQQQQPAAAGKQLNSPQEIFSIATPTVTNTSLSGDNLDEGSFLMQSASCYNPAERQFMNQHSHQQPQPELPRVASTIQAPVGSLSQPAPNLATTGSSQEQTQSQAHLGSKAPAASHNEQSPAAGAAEDQAAQTPKKKKGARKAAKLDTKSKLEKSRQSARECRARKKLRYQYLEDLVCNREKAVVKLREELSMFCEMSKRLDEGTISEQERHLLVEQTKENSGKQT